MAGGASSLFFGSLPVHCLLLLLLMAAPSAVAQQGGARNISLGSTMESGGSVWTSPSGDFAFGFYPIQPANETFLLGVWFDKIHGEDPGGSRAEIKTDGRLVLYNHAGQLVWDSGDAGQVNVAYAAMLDTGNFVLCSNTSVIGWQSFAYPVDTILPTQEINRGGLLSSRRLPSDYSAGRFQLRLQTTGEMCLNTINLPTKFPYDPYCNVKMGRQIVFNQTSGRLVVKTDEGIREVVSAGIYTLENYYQRATLDPDGVLRLYVYPKRYSGTLTTPAGTWSVAGFFPDNFCQDVYVKIGSGPCGFNSYCTLNNSYPICICPPGYSPIDPADGSKGCRTDYVGRGCNDDGSPAEGSDMFDMEQIADADWPMSDYEQLSPVDEVKCRRSCLEDCFCAVAIYRNGSCWKKRMPLGSSPSSSSSSSSSRLVMWVLLGLSGFINLSVLIALIVLSLCSPRGLKKLLQWQGKREPDARCRGAYNHVRSFSFRELERATGHFQKELGKGSFGVVYKGTLEFSGERTHIAVKMLKGLSEEGENEFQAEVNAIGQIHHRNLVRLLGFCDEGSHRLLIYELMSNGSLADYLFAAAGGERPPWEQRIHIAFGVARGLVYLHDECRAQIIHCDIKPQNVLLDGDLRPKIADFGLAKPLYANQTRTQTAIRGTKGYVAPEWFKSTSITSKVDVYSYGVLLLEILCCRRNVPAKDTAADEPILTDLAYDCYRYNQVSQLVPDGEEGLVDMKELERLVAVALWCILDEPSLRPSMKKVLLMLEDEAEVPTPPEWSSTRN
ncbi:unnamed protein product [Spirodela intermedia]|uniref:Receptor-like serine/threonine-protein kinase n=1 Tax=Spirodela intermedia TaxID=51605 RepID=A0A7I8L028_SPIIN|nr:unnamed protein product [Spirodela intermedia]